MKKKNLIEFAESLKQTREKKKISLQQVKTQTRISLEYLEAIEKGDFDVMPPVYMRAFIKEYAEAIGLDGSEVLNEYDSVKSGKKTSEETSANETVSGKEEITGSDITFTDEAGVKHSSNEPVNKTPQWIIPAAGGLILLIIFAVAYFSFFSSSDKIIVEEKPYSEVVKENISRFEEPPAKLTENEPAAIDSLNLVLIATDSCWVKVNFDGDSLKTTDFIMFKGHRKKLKAARNFKLVLGNSGGVKLLLNGDTLRFEGAKGKVKTLIVNKNGILKKFR